MIFPFGFSKCATTAHPVHKRPEFKSNLATTLRKNETDPIGLADAAISLPFLPALAFDPVIFQASLAVALAIRIVFEPWTASKKNHRE